MRKAVIAALGTAAIVSIYLTITAVAFANRPPTNPPACPAGYTQDAASTNTVLLCTRTVTNTVVRNVPGPTVYVDVPGPTVEKIVEKVVEVPVDRLVVKYKWKVKRVVHYRWKFKHLVRYHTQTIYVHCKVPGQG